MLALFFFSAPYIRRMKEFDEHVAYCALNRIFGFHPRLAQELLSNVVSPLELFTRSTPIIPNHPELSGQLTPGCLEWAEGELEKVEQLGARFIDIGSDDYPDILRDCEDPPLGLYFKSDSPPAQVFSLRPMVAVVGTRDISPYGKAWCRKLVDALAHARVPPTIVSGLAFGADGIAHQTALDAGLPTIGVMATGIEKVYPWQHEKLARDISLAPGSALISDYPLDTQPVALNFLRRNRIIAGLCTAVVVIESKSKGGSLMTARYAAGYGRDIFALPGRADDVRSAGCNSLIRENMAGIITTAGDLAYRLGLGPPVRGAGGSWVSGDEGVLNAISRRHGQDSPLLKIAGAIRENCGVTAESLCTLLDWPFAKVLEGIGLLEAEGYIESDFLGRCSLSHKK